MRRGDLVLAAAKGDYGKVRPCLVIQSDLLNPTHDSVVVCLVESGFLTGGSSFRIPVAPGPDNGLDRPSEVMTDKVAAIKVGRVRRTIGRLDDAAMEAVDRALLFVLGFA
jgi:mRNA interferase MazF